MTNSNVKFEALRSCGPSASKRTSARYYRRPLIILAPWLSNNRMGAFSIGGWRHGISLSRVAGRNRSIPTRPHQSGPCGRRVGGALQGSRPTQSRLHRREHRGTLSHAHQTRTSPQCYRRVQTCRCAAIGHWQHNGARVSQKVGRERSFLGSLATGLRQGNRSWRMC